MSFGASVPMTNKNPFKLQVVILQKGPSAIVNTLSTLSRGAESGPVMKANVARISAQVKPKIILP
jgi:hypothetical protein